jgi:hypothetical protein
LSAGAGRGYPERAVDLSAFERSLANTAPPAGLSAALEALWYERRGDWNRAHEIAQDVAGDDAAWVHAYLHRREGDQPNAAYWYRQARKPVMRSSLDDEWRGIVDALLRAQESLARRVP